MTNLPTDNAKPQIVVNADPTKDQLEAAFRQAITVLGPIIAVLATTGWGQKIGLDSYWNAFIAASSSIATIVAIVVGQIKTRSVAKKAAAMANELPNHVATTK